MATNVKNRLNNTMLTTVEFINILGNSHTENTFLINKNDTMKNDVWMDRDKEVCNATVLSPTGLR